jgi:hypothetical protein
MRDEDNKNLLLYIALTLILCSARKTNNSGEGGKLNKVVLSWALCLNTK